MADHIDHTAEAETCKTMVSEGGNWPGFHECGRKVKEDGLCGVHLAAKRRVEARREADNAASRESARKGREVTQFLEDCGIKASPQFGANGVGYTGRVVITLDELKRILGDPS